MLEGVSLSTRRKHLARDPQCGFTGNSDIYGAGIRVGIYTQALAVGFANYFVLHEARVLRAVNTLFVLTMFIGTLFLSRVPSQTYAIEAFLLIQITFIIYLVGVIDASRYGRKAWKFSAERTLVRQCSYLGMLIYNIWFWWVGLGQMRETPCGTFILFLILKVNLYGWIRAAHKVLSILAICNHISASWENLFEAYLYFASKQFSSPLFLKALEDSLRTHQAEAHEDIASLVGSNQSLVYAQGDGTKGSKSPSIRSQKNSSHTPRKEGQPHNCSSRTQSETSIVESIPIRQGVNASSDTEPKKAKSAAPISEAENVQNGLPAQFLPAFSNLYAADMYISEILATGSFGVTKTKRWEVSLFKGILKLYLPSFRIQTSADQPSLKECINTITNAVRQDHMNTKALATGLFKIYTLRTYPIYKLPWGLHSALTHPNHQTQDWRALIIISDIRSSREKTKSRKLYWVPYAAQTIFLFIGLIVATELHIHWNHISGVQYMDSVGQLIPMLLGVGGLLKVLWAKGKMVWRGSDNCLDEAANNGEAVATAYYRQKNFYEEFLRGPAGSA
ncbi:MAG: hypothetical protein M1812_003929 [Candelaria pacifica]|nr:MAG: hypothetical protein M1812_003929 [Candelaria pacifica]